MPGHPVRLQLSRHKGFDLARLSRKTNGREAVVVSRPSKFGNPFGMELGRERAVALHGKWLKKTLTHAEVSLAKAQSAKALAERRETVLADISLLRGKNLACWCPLDGPCHGELLLKLANA